MEWNLEGIFGITGEEVRDTQKTFVEYLKETQNLVTRI